MSNSGRSRTGTFKNSERALGCCHGSMLAENVVARSGHGAAPGAGHGAFFIP